MKAGVVYPQTEFGGDTGAVKAFAQAAEHLGYDHIVSTTHVLGAVRLSACAPILPMTGRAISSDLHSAFLCCPGPTYSGRSLRPKASMRRGWSRPSIDDRLHVTGLECCHGPDIEAKPSRVKVGEHRGRLRSQGLRPSRFGCWTCARRPSGQAHRQSLAVATSAHAREDQAFIDAVSDWRDESGVARLTVAGGRDYAGKPRPVVIVQDDSFDAQTRSRCAPSPPMKQKPLCSACLSNRMTATDCWRPAG